MSIDSLIFVQKQAVPGARGKLKGVYTDVHDRKLPQKLVLGTLCAIQRTAAPSLGDACGIQSAADDVIADAGKVLDPAAADEHGRVFLKVVTFAGNVDRTFLLVGEPYPGNLTDSRVGLFGRGGRNRNADSALLICSSLCYSAAGGTCGLWNISLTCIPLNANRKSENLFNAYCA